MDEEELADFHKERRKRFLEEKEVFENRWGWLANIFASLIIGFFLALEAVLNALFNILCGIVSNPGS